MIDRNVPKMALDTNRIRKALEYDIWHDNIIFCHVFGFKVNPRYINV